MKRIVALLLILALLFSCGALAEGKLTAKDLNTDDSFRVKLRQMIRLKKPSGGEYYYYRVQQGSATDGKYAYTILENQRINRSSIWKIDMKDWSVVNTVYDLALDHSNDMTYNPKINRLIVAHNAPNYSTISFVDPDTLQVTESRKICCEIFAIAYEPSRDQYIVGISGTFDFAVLDADFNKVARCRGIDTGRIRQGVDCDENYVYFPQVGEDYMTDNCIVVYDWAGNYINTVTMKKFQEIESMFHWEDDWYLAFNYNGSIIYRADLERVEKQ